MKKITMYFIIFALLVLVTLSNSPVILFKEPYSRIASNTNVTRKDDNATNATYHNKTNISNGNSGTTNLTTPTTSTSGGEYITVATAALSIKPIQLPAFSFPGRLDVDCSREYYCRQSRCTAPNVSSAFSLTIMEDYLFGHVSGQSQRRKSIQFWGDSINAQMECDFRQWQHDYLSQQQQYSNKNSSYERIKSTFVQVGCPWRNCTPATGWGAGLTNMARKAHVIVFNIGAHYEFLDAEKIENDIRKYEPYLRAFVHEHHGLVIVRSPSPTHFDTPTGLANREIIRELRKIKLAQNLTNNDLCAPLSRMPPVIQHQDDMLRAMAHRISAFSEDVYSLSLDHWNDKREDTAASDCKHFCQSCGIWRAWNIGVAEQMVKHFSRK